MDVEIDRRRPDALPVLRRRGDARGKRGFRLSAARRAAIDRGLMLRDFDQPVRQIEHLPPLHVPLHRNRQPRQTKPARLRLVPHDPIGLGDLPKRVALVSRLPAAFLVRAPAEAAGDARLLLQPIARRRLGTSSNCPSPVGAGGRRSAPAMPRCWLATLHSRPEASHCPRDGRPATPRSPAAATRLRRATARCRL